MTTSRGRRAPALLATIVGIAACLPLMAGCSTAKSITCESYADRDTSDRQSLVQELIRSHDLDPKSNVMAAAKISVDIERYCGISVTESLGSGKAKATKHNNDAIDNAVDWKAAGAKK